MTRSAEKLIHAALRDGCREHCDALIDGLRRLSAENESLRQIVQDFPPVEAELREVSDRAHRLETQRDALLEALEFCAGTSCATDANDVARAAIAKAEGEKT